MTTTTRTTGHRLSPKAFHRFAALTEMVTWSLLILGMILKYSGVTEALTPIAGGIHGFGFLTFLAITALLWINNRWSPAQGIVGLAVSVVPFAAWPFTLWADRKGLLDGGWRFSGADERPDTVPEKVLAQFVRRPARSIAVLLVVIAAVFTVLLLVGQPYDPDAIADRVN